MSDDHNAFFKLEGSTDAHGNDLVLSRAAFTLHAAAIVNSVRDGHPGFVSDDYLDAISAETTLTSVELCMSGQWQRTTGGYLIHDPDLVAAATRFNQHNSEEVTDGA